MSTHLHESVTDICPGDAYIDDPEHTAQGWCCEVLCRSTQKTLHRTEPLPGRRDAQMAAQLWLRKAMTERSAR